MLITKALSFFPCSNLSLFNQRDLEEFFWTGPVIDTDWCGLQFTNHVYVTFAQTDNATKFVRVLRARTGVHNVYSLISCCSSFSDCETEARRGWKIATVIPRNVLILLLIKTCFKKANKHWNFQITPEISSTSSVYFVKRSLCNWAQNIQLRLSTCSCFPTPSARFYFWDRFMQKKTWFCFTPGESSSGINAVKIWCWRFGRRRYSLE